MTRILSTDLLVADLMAQVEGQPALQALSDEFKLVPGGKRSLDDEQARHFAEVFAKAKFDSAPGGSSANVLVTLSKLLGKQVEIRFVGIASDGANGDMIRHAMKDAGINLMPEHVPHGVRRQEAVSYVLVFKDGQCSIATHPGNARQVLKPALLAEHVVEHCDVLLAQGSLWHKFNAEFADRLFSLCMKHQRSLWLTLPTQPHLGAPEREKITDMIPHAELVLGNESELNRLFNAATPEALKQLQGLLRTQGGAPRVKGIAFITLGAQGTLLVTHEKVQQYLPVEVPGGNIVNTIGAGDTAYAGFCAAYLKGMELAEAAQLGMLLAAHKLVLNTPRLPDPLEVLRRSAPETALTLGSQ